MDEQNFTVATLAAVAERLRRSTVQIRSGSGVGSGVIWRANGLIITNAHVARQSRTVVELADGRVLEATCIRRDTRQDLAALQAESRAGDDSPFELFKRVAPVLPAVDIADADTLRVGELVFAVGNPHGVVGAVATGVISRLHPAWVMADIRLAPGNSGGLLANAQGKVIGINTMIVAGMAVAVPSNAVERFLAPTALRKPDLGLTLQPVSIFLQNQQILGLLVLDVDDNSCSALSGLNLGDVLIGVNNQLFSTTEDLTAALLQGNILHLELIRGGKRMSCDVKLDSGLEAA